MKPTVILEFFGEARGHRLSALIINRIILINGYCIMIYDICAWIQVQVAVPGTLEQPDWPIVVV